jgi:hypothetical protein
MCDFPDLLQQYANTLTSKKIMFRVSKPCGYSQLIMLPRMETSNQVNVSDLLNTIHNEMGSYTDGKIYFYPKISTSLAAATTPPFFLIHQTAIREPLAKFALTHIPTAYSIEDCKYAVYQLYIDTQCQHGGCSCKSDFSVPPQSSAFSLSYPQEEDSMCIDNEPTREELLSLMYDDVAPPPPPTSPSSPSLSPSPSLLCDSHPLPAAQPGPPLPPATTRPMPSSSAIVTPWG